jgi:glycine/D-amino acid oxidase-like deaminating enzyme
MIDRRIGTPGLRIILQMPQRATKRGDERTALDRDCDVLICGASFAGLAVARELAGAGADVLMIDRYEIGERQTSACGIPTGWLHALGLADLIPVDHQPAADVSRARHPHPARLGAIRAAVDLFHV